MLRGRRRGSRRRSRRGRRWCLRRYVRHCGGWHANNGVVLNNPRLGFDCTGQTVGGQPGLEGYYKEWDRDLSEDERLQFSPGEACPRFQADKAPHLDKTSWPEDRLQKVLRNYAMDYITSIVPEAVAVLGPEEGGHLAGAAARLVGMHTYDDVAALLGGIAPGPVGFATAFTRLANGQGDDATMEAAGNAATVRQRRHIGQRPAPRLQPHRQRAISTRSASSDRGARGIDGKLSGNITEINHRPR